MEERRVYRNRRQRNRRQEDRLAVYFTKQIPLRQVPGAVVLGITNLIAGLFVFDLILFSPSFVNVYLSSIIVLPVWSMFFFISGATLTASGFYKRWWLFNVGATMSMFLWGAISTSIFFSLFTDHADPSPIKLAMAWWMIAGQMVMLNPPLYKKREDL